MQYEAIPDAEVGQATKSSSTSSSSPVPRGNVLYLAKYLFSGIMLCIFGIGVYLLSPHIVRILRSSSGGNWDVARLQRVASDSQNLFEIGKDFSRLYKVYNEGSDLYSPLGIIKVQGSGAIIEFLENMRSLSTQYSFFLPLSATSPTASSLADRSSATTNDDFIPPIINYLLIQASSQTEFPLISQLGVSFVTGNNGTCTAQFTRHLLQAFSREYEIQAEWQVFDYSNLRGILRTCSAVDKSFRGAAIDAVFPPLLSSCTEWSVKEISDVKAKVFEALLTGNTENLKFSNKRSAYRLKELATALKLVGENLTLSSQDYLEVASLAGQQHSVASFMVLLQYRGLKTQSTKFPLDSCVGIIQMVVLIEFKSEESTLAEVTKILPVLDSGNFLQTLRRCSFDGSYEAAVNAYDSYHLAVNRMQREFVGQSDSFGAGAGAGAGPDRNRHIVDDDQVSGSYYYSYYSENERSRVNQPTSYPTQSADKSSGCFYAPISENDDGAGSHRMALYCPNGWQMVGVWCVVTAAFYWVVQWYFVGTIL